MESEHKVAFVGGWALALLGLFGVSLGVAYMSPHYAVGWAFALMLLIPIFPMTLFCVSTLWPEWKRHEKYYARGGVLWYFAATDDPESQLDRKIEGRCPECNTRIEFDPGEVPLCAKCPDKKFGSDGEYNGVKNAVIREAVADWKNWNGFRYVLALRRAYGPFSVGVVFAIGLFAFLARPAEPASAYNPDLTDGNKSDFSAILRDVEKNRKWADDGGDSVPYIKPSFGKDKTLLFIHNDSTYTARIAYRELRGALYLNDEVVHTLKVPDNSPLDILSDHPQWTLDLIMSERWNRAEFTFDGYARNGEFSQSLRMVRDGKRWGCSWVARMRGRKDKKGVCPLTVL